jgi:hypothetical protein
MIALPSNLPMSFGSEGIEGKAFRIVTSDTCEVYSLSYLPQTMDASIVYPIDALGSDYRVLSYDGTVRNLPPYPSEMQVVAVEDSTHIEITSTDRTVGGQLPGVPFTVMMRAGEVFQVEGDTDLTGSRVRSLNGKRFAMFSGSSRPFIPVNVPYRDFVFEQCIPMNRWGSYYVAVPTLTRDGDTYRVLAGTDSTTVRVDGMAPFRLDAGKFKEFMLTAPSVIQADQPIHVAQYTNGSQYDFASFGDPAMLVLNPVDIVRHDVRFYSFPLAAISKHYVSIVTLNRSLDQVLLDGVQIIDRFKPVPGDPFYAYAQIEVPEGPHRISSYWGVNAYPYSFGQEGALSYNTGADDLRPCRTPVISVFGDTVFCDGDSVLFDAGPGFLTYEWSDGSRSRTLTAKATGIYSVITLDSNGCLRPSRPVSVTVRQNPQPAIAVTPGPTICPCDSATLIAPSGFRYLWSTGDTTQSIVVHASGTYGVAVTDSFGCGGSTSTSVAVETLMPAVMLGSAEARSGDAIEIPLVLVDGGLAGCGYDDFTATIRYNRRLMIPRGVSDGTLTQGQSAPGPTAILSVRGRRVGDTLTRFRFMAALADTDAAEITIDTIVWNQCTTVRTDTSGGAFRLLGICYQGGPRLIDVTGVVGLKIVRANEAASRATLEYTVQEKAPASITLADALGRHIATIVSGDAVPGRYSVFLDLTDLPSGQYYCTLRTPGAVRTVPLRVVR